MDQSPVLVHVAGLRELFAAVWARERLHSEVLAEVVFYIACLPKNCLAVIQTALVKLVSLSLNWSLDLVNSAGPDWKLGKRTGYLVVRHDGG